MWVSLGMFLDRIFRDFWKGRQCPWLCNTYQNNIFLKNLINKYLLKHWTSLFVQINVIICEHLKQMPLMVHVLKTVMNEISVRQSFKREKNIEFLTRTCLSYKRKFRCFNFLKFTTVFRNVFLNICQDICGHVTNLPIYDICLHHSVQCACCSLDILHENIHFNVLNYFSCSNAIFSLFKNSEEL